MIDLQSQVNNLTKEEQYLKDSLRNLNKLAVILLMLVLIQLYAYLHTTNKVGQVKAFADPIFSELKKVKQQLRDGFIQNVADKSNE